MAERSYLSIGDVLALLRDEFPDITISKIRFLESRGLLIPERTASGYRKFYDHDVDRLRWILRQQREHFLPLKVIKGRLEGAEAVNEPASLFDATAVGCEEPAPAFVEPLEGESNLVSMAARVAAHAAAVAAESGSGERSGHPSAGLVEHGDADSCAERQPIAVGAEAMPTAGSATAGVERLGAAPASPGFPADMRASASHSTSQAASQELTSTASDAQRPGLTATGGPASLAASTFGPAASAGASLRSSLSSQPPASEPPAQTAVSASPRQDQTSSATPPAAGSTPGSAGPPAEDHRRPSAGRDALANLSGASMTAGELAHASGLSVDEVEQLESFGLIAGRNVAGVRCYDEDALAVAGLAASFSKFGIEARHLRIFKHAAERQASLYSQVVLPLLRQRNPDARAKAASELQRLSDLGGSLQACFARAALRELTGG